MMRPAILSRAEFRAEFSAEFFLAGHPNVPYAESLKPSGGAIRKRHRSTSGRALRNPMSILQKKVFERVLSMAQMHNIGVLHHASDMLWTCRWNEQGQESSICYQIMKEGGEKSLQMRLRYSMLGRESAGREILDYSVPIKASLSFKRKVWYWFVCPLVINGKPCAKRVRNLYFLPSSNYFGCKNCRDLMIRSLPPSEQFLFRRTEYLAGEERGGDQEGSAFNPQLQLGWRPGGTRELCQECGCLSEGTYCCHCGKPIDPAQGETYFDLLNVKRDAGDEEIQAAFKLRIKEYHPDRVAHLGRKLRALAEKEIKQINLAYEVLKAAERRNAYLREIEAREIRT